MKVMLRILAVMIIAGAIMSALSLTGIVKTARRQAVPRVTAATMTLADADVAVEEMDRRRQEWIHAELERQRKAASVAALTAYMEQAHFLPQITAMASLMVDLGDSYQVDARLCAVTISAEASGGRGSDNLFGSMAGAVGNYEAQVYWYFQRVHDIGEQYGRVGDNYWLAWYWHGGGSAGADHDFYAGNVAATVNTIERR